MAEQRRPCRCLLAEAGERDMAQLVAEYIASLDESVRAEETLYQSRLAICRECPELISGTCRLCGCSVETRAAKRAQRCPHVPAHW